MKYIALPAETYTAVLNYLAGKPYREVAQLINRMGLDAKAVEVPAPAEKPAAPPAEPAAPAVPENETQGAA
jgi:hypothetical protein